LGPGFDSLGLALQLHSFISIRQRRNSDGPERVWPVDSAPNVPLDESNICYRAAVKLLLRVGAPARDFVVENGKQHSAFARSGFLLGGARR
jgi:homoserine kinase